jgi:glycosyltransferase involved in cell wall biosynthesis
VLFIALGEGGHSEHIGRAEVRGVPFERDATVVAQYYQAADVYAHAARADTFPNTVLEAMACGTPVVATAVGGIPEQVRDQQTGFLVLAGNAEAMANRLVQVLSDDIRRANMSAQAVEVTRQHYDLNKQVDHYLDWYQRLVQQKEHATLGKEA